ncbi:trypco2 family protein [Paraburkholderia metrosideri]|uniref:Trypsin-co-occurring domain-containing protein n=1 Tax=Paraburkholderia metrosideri TaxID=580937 RepID=A0ABM8NCD2_9BURK|nr:trypco2 family protein [Paraburkholderia metrosideri]CAD6516468.1 hypothetical protein LMG28140_00786 [Paraburkholderia metrosideri]
MKAALYAVVPIVLGACCSTREPVSPPASVDMSVVIDRVKMELNRFQHSPVSATGVHGGVCTGIDNGPVIYIVATQAELTLKAVSTNTVEGSVGAKIPAGKIVTVSPGFSGSYKTVGTHTLTLNLDIQHTPSASEIQSNIDAATKEIDSYKKAQTAITNVDSSAAGRFGRLISQRMTERTNSYIALAVAAPDSPRGPSTVADVPAPENQKAVNRDISALPTTLAAYPLAATLWTLREQLLHVDHGLTPCLKPEKLEAEIDFEVQKDAQGKLGIDVLIVSVSASRERNDDATQHLKVTFDMSGSTELLLDNEAAHQ